MTIDVFFYFFQISYFLHRQYEIISGYLVGVYKHYAPIIQFGVLQAYNWLEVSIPKAYRFMLTNVLLLKKTIYELNPPLFDKVYVIISDAIEYVVKMVPIVVERCLVALNILLETIRSYLVKSQSWMQQQFKK